MCHVFAISYLSFVFAAALSLSVSGSDNLTADFLSCQTRVFPFCLL
jgi:hypothetical protein